MVKKVKVLVLIISLFLVVGCMDYKFVTTINQNKSVDIKMSMEMDMLEYMNNMVSNEDVWGEIKNQVISSTCASMCPNESSSEYEACMTECMSSFSSDDITMPSEEEIKAYLDEFINSDEFNEEEFMSSEDIEELESKGFIVKTSVDKENYIYRIDISQHFNNIDNISSGTLEEVHLEDVFNGDGDNIFFKKLENGSYQANYVFEISEDDISYEGLDFSEYLTISYEVVLPNKSVSNNADSVSSDGKTLSWDLANSEMVNYEFSFDTVDNSSNSGSVNISDDNLKIIAICLIAGGILGLVVVTIILIKKSKKD